MSARKVLLPVHQALLARSANRRRKLADDLASLRDFRTADSAGDNADVAFEASSDELSAQLAERDALELSQIERATLRLRQGLYGICEGGSGNCQRKIPLARLKACPHTTFCINCEREMEKHPGWLERRDPGHWGHVLAAEVRMEDLQINLCELEMDQSRKGTTFPDPWKFQGFFGANTR
jgi:DnaK suppressor protein